MGELSLKYSLEDCALKQSQIQYRHQEMQDNDYIVTSSCTNAAQCNHLKLHLGATGAGLLNGGLLPPSSLELPLENRFQRYKLSDGRMQISLVECTERPHADRARQTCASKRHYGRCGEYVDGALVSEFDRSQTDWRQSHHLARRLQQLLSQHPHPAATVMLPGDKLDIELVD